MTKKVLFSAKQQRDVIRDVITILEDSNEIDLVYHDPLQDYYNLKEIGALFKGVDYVIVKVANENSIDLLHYAKLHQFRTLHDIDTVLLCKNKVALDQAIRKVLECSPDLASKFQMPDSWLQNINPRETFKEWAAPKLPIVLKSHYQHDKYMRFNFLVRKLEDIDTFCSMYNHFLYYDLYVQKFIDCDGWDRKVYVIGDQVYGVIRENPIYKFIRENSKSIDTKELETERFEISKAIEQLAQALAKELGLKIFGFDLITPTKKDVFYLLDINDFPGFSGVDEAQEMLVSFFKQELSP